MPENAFLSELPEVQERGELQVELALERLDDDLALGLGAEWGLTDAWQVEVEVGGVLDAAATGLETVEVGVLYGRSPNETWSWAAGVGVELRPNGLGGVPEDVVALESSVLVSWNWDGLGLFAELSGEWVTDDGDVPDGGPTSPLDASDGVEEIGDEASFGVGGFMMTSWGAWIVEVAAERELDEDETEVAAAFGAVWRIVDDVEIGLAAVVGVDGGDDGGVATLTVEF
ncbi:MAG: hypothetical protein AAFY88_14255 [Acidobacteriota bacterium]